MFGLLFLAILVGDPVCHHGVRLDVVCTLCTDGAAPPVIDRSAAKAWLRGCNPAPDNRDNQGMSAR